MTVGLNVTSRRRWTARCGSTRARGRLLHWRVELPPGPWEGWEDSAVPRLGSDYLRDPNNAGIRFLDEAR